MKAKMTKMLMAAFLATTCLMSAQAHIAIVKQTPALPGHPSMAQFKPGIDLSHYDLKIERNGIKTYASKPHLRSKSVSAAPGQTATVTCNIVGDEQKFGQGYGFVVTLLNSDMYANYFTSEWGSNQVICTDVPIGTYDFETESSDLFGAVCCFVKEQVNITSDTTIVLDLNGATNRVEANMYKPDGTLCTVPVIDFYNTGEIVEEGTVPWGMGIQFAVVSKEANATATSFFFGRGFDILGSEPGNRFYINNVSDRIKILLSCAASESTMDYVMSQSKDGIDGDFTFANDPADYVLYQEQFQPTPAYVPEAGAGTSEFSMRITYNGFARGGVSCSSKRLCPDGLTSFYIDAPERDDNSTKMLCRSGFADSRVEVVEDWSWTDENGVFHEEYDTTYFNRVIYGSPAEVSKSGVEYFNSGHNGNYSFYVSEDPEADMRDYPGNPHFAFTDRQKALAYGTGCPINSVMAQNSYQQGDKYSYLEFVYLGRYGEVRGSDAGIENLRITYNQDSVICTDISAMRESMINFAMEHKKGQLDVDVANTNVEVDGLPGKNLTHVFYDWTQEDWTAPTLQMLWLRGTDGTITDRFASGDKGVLEFAGGDFNFHLTPDRFWFDCQPQTVEVSYSPYDTDNWEPFAVEEVPENFFMPGFGYFYRGELSQVEGNGEKGWFDLKIKLTDQSGNWQEQVISPAFRIDNLAYSNVATVGKDNAREVARYNLAGQRVDGDAKGVVIVKMSDGTARKILVP